MTRLAIDSINSSFYLAGVMTRLAVDFSLALRLLLLVLLYYLVVLCLFVCLFLLGDLALDLAGKEGGGDGSQHCDWDSLAR